MTTFTRWNPIGEFEDLLDRYNRQFGLARTNGEREGRDLIRRSDWAPAVDIREGKDLFVIEAELPGLTKKDVKVTVHEGVLSIEGERHQVEAQSDEKLHRTERLYGSFLRRFTLPDNIDESSIQAHFKDGLLSLSLKKAEPVQPKAIEVEVH
ncbi:Hsp20/alpha crystallin family protein [Marinobacter caseinilyticus]|uniref:Hsp20/alpha crystallin family protein n=1 Tax=Marinobacter caseinilyticus TaxID=2692195 RepID=UPI00140E2CDF|nr:Hsp20/alpha crystallin family protein [Marinobacter caseinilyticus]